VNDSKQTNTGSEDQQSTERFLRQLNERLDHSVEALDVSTQARLRAARREALAASGVRSLSAWLMPMGSLAAVATVAVLTVSLWLLPPEKGMDDQLPPLEDFALLSDSEGLEFYEDLDFYLWLDDEKKAG
jgi:hypothetical protein